MTTTSKNEEQTPRRNAAPRGNPSATPVGTSEEKARYIRAIRLARALNKFTQHHDYCTWLSARGGCNCGLDTLRLELGK
jgi:hypothetical protein